MTTCDNCAGTRAVPDFGDGEDGYMACPSCVIEDHPAGTYVVWEASD